LMDGYKFIEEFKTLKAETLENVKLIVLSESTSISTQKKVFGTGPVQHIFPKPLSISNLQLLIQEN